MALAGLDKVPFAEVSNLGAWICKRHAHLVQAVMLEIRLWGAAQGAGAQSAVGPIQRLHLHLCRHYTDAVLITVVALCALENDVIHAGYLALALLLFRRRETLRMERSRLFKWMAIYNFAVIVLTLAFQAPFEDAWGSIWEPQRKVNSVALLARLLARLLADVKHFSQWAALNPHGFAY